MDTQRGPVTQGVGASMFQQMQTHLEKSRVAMMSNSLLGIDRLFGMHTVAAFAYDRAGQL